MDHCDSRYAQVAAALGWDTSRNATIPCAMGNASFASALFDVYFDADPLRNMDFAWTDYGGCGTTMPLAWNNVVYGAHRATRGARPMVLSRWGGLGTHRYPVGFSGDTFQHELTLDWEIATTATAANVLHRWSHDVGGFHDGPGAPGTGDPANATGSELYLRWQQFAALSPVLRTHQNKQGDCATSCERRIWMFPDFALMREAFRLRAALVPYLYSLDRAAADSGVLPVHATYLDWSAEDEAYSFGHQYMFGALLAAPISAMVDNATNTTPRAVWLPPGAWSRWDGSAVLAGGAVDNSSYTKAQVPLFAPAGLLLPLATPDPVHAVDTSPALTWVVFPGGANGSAAVWEDDGASLAYTAGAGATTAAAYSRTLSGMLTLTVAPTQGSYAGMPPQRAHSLQVRGVGRDTVAFVRVNGSAVPAVAPGSGVAPGWYVVPAPSISLVYPAGALVVDAGAADMGAGVAFEVQLQM